MTIKSRDIHKLSVPELMSRLTESDISRLKEPELSKLIEKFSDAHEEQREITNRSYKFGTKETSEGKKIPSPRYTEEEKKFYSLRNTKEDLERRRGHLEEAEVHKKIKERINKKYPNYNKMSRRRQDNIYVEEMERRINELEELGEKRGSKGLTSLESREHGRLEGSLEDASLMRDAEDEIARDEERKRHDRDDRERKKKLKAKNPNVEFIEDKRRESAVPKILKTPTAKRIIGDFEEQVREQQERKKAEKEASVQERRAQIRVVKKGETGLPVKPESTNVISDSEFTNRSNTKADVIPMSERRTPNITPPRKTSNEFSSRREKLKRIVKSHPYATGIAGGGALSAAFLVDAYRRGGMEGLKEEALLEPALMGIFGALNKASKSKGLVGKGARGISRGLSVPMAASLLYEGAEDVAGASRGRTPEGVAAQAGIAANLLGQLAFSDIPKMVRERLHSEARYGTPEKAARTRRGEVWSGGNRGRAAVLSSMRRNRQEAQAKQGAQRKTFRTNLEDMQRQGIIAGNTQMFDQQLTKALEDSKTSKDIISSYEESNKRWKEKVKPATIEGQYGRLFEAIGSNLRTEANEKRKGYTGSVVSQEIEDLENLAQEYEDERYFYKHIVDPQEMDPAERRRMKEMIAPHKLTLKERYPRAYERYGTLNIEDKEE
jgi:hypothetical protein